ncbi:hypothetical protein BZL30_5160 [Mycobacterium kansasii]|uniref:Uncharacterized protein n=1 Tax=Mycobacterium kansasii TaxID=1768 RepID=A0A1V3X4R7_MYCKA|nr:hypothetical protein BZL30_5160 [Mycobacterium kansasii]
MTTLPSAGSLPISTVTGDPVARVVADATVADVANAMVADNVGQLSSATTNGPPRWSANATSSGSWPPGKTRILYGPWTSPPPSWCGATPMRPSTRWPTG